MAITYLSGLFYFGINLDVDIIAVANASAEAKAAAKYMTVSNEEDAIARIIEELERKYACSR